MARWRLTEKHYIKTDPATEWEHVEQDLVTGKVIRRRFEVPVFLDPNQLADQNYRETGEIIVCHKGKGQPRDIVFTGPPTPGMAPLDDEAQALSDRQALIGQHPIESLPVNDGVAPVTLQALQAQINTLLLANDELQRRMAAKETEALPEVAPDASEIAASEAAAKAAEALQPRRRV